MSKSRRHPCSDCQSLCWGLRCRKCEIQYRTTGHPTSIQNLSPEAAAWLGAMVEGEGSLSWDRPNTCNNQYRLRVVVANTEVETIATCLRLVGAGRVTSQVMGNSKRVWHWVLSRRSDIAALLPQILPYLTGKREKALEALVVYRPMAGGARFVPVVSAALVAVKYERERSRLVVQFGEDTFYEYDGVSPEVVLDFLFADSIGSAFDALVKKGGFQYRKLRAADALI